MGSAILWYLTISIIGWLTFPLAYRLLPGLKDRGYTASRTLGLLLWGYVFWLLASLGVLHNDIGGLLFALALVIGLSAWSLNRHSLKDITGWLRNQRRMVLTTEIAFLIAFAAWTIVRAANPEAAGTEKPMELAFINAILNSPTFPPHDPWLSGYAISYYYFGYVLTAMLARLTATPGIVAFNLGIALIFALSATGAYGLLYNLLNARRSSASDQQPSAPAYTLSSLLGPVFLLFVSNLEGFLHSLHNLGLFWRRDPNGELASAFWRWLDIKDLNLPPSEPFTLAPTRFWWWWRASRVLQDYDLAGNPKEIIDEFPFFSYLLGDLHPHVLIMPFTFLVMTLALNLFLGGASGQWNWLKLRLKGRTLAWGAALIIPLGLALTVFGALRLSLGILGLGVLAMLLGGFLLVRLRHQQPDGDFGLIFWDEQEVTVGKILHLSPFYFLLSGIALGGMAFLNTWDFPFYLALFCAAYALSRMLAQNANYSAVVMDFIWLGLALGIAVVLLYLPFFLSFSSQAGGILPNLIYPTRGVHLWVMFAPLMLPILALLLYLVDRNKKRASLLKGFQLALGFTLALWIFSLFLGLAIIIVPEVGALYQSTISSPNGRELFLSALSRRAINPGGWLTLLFLLTLIATLLARLEPRPRETETTETQALPQSANPQFHGPPYSAASIFTILLILWGTLLVLGPEFLYLRDMFGWRMNTIFKFYYQAWLLWSIAAAYGSVVLLENLRGAWGTVFRLAWVLVIGMSLVYPVFGLWNKTNGFQPPKWTLDSSIHLENSSPDEMAAIRWLSEAPAGVVAESVPSGGGSYTSYGRVSMISGMPAVLGWVGHESQWRGGHEAMGSRQSDLERLYCSRDWEETRTILDEYNIRYVFVGPLERGTYQAQSGACPLGVVDTKFMSHLAPVYDSSGVTIYEYIPNKTTD